MGVLLVGAISVSNYWVLPLAGAAALAILTLCSLNRVLAWAVYFFAITANGLVVSAGFGTLRPELMALPVLGIIILQDRSRTDDLPRRRILSPLAFASTIWLLVTALSSAFVAPEQLRSLWICIQIAAAVGTYFALSNSKHKALFFKIGSRIISSIAALSIALYFTTKFGSLKIPFEFGVAEDGRLIGLSFEVNVFAAQCVGWLAVMFARRGSKLRHEYLMVATLAVAVVLGGTRAAWIALGLIACFKVVDLFRQGKVSQSMSICIAILLGLVYLIAESSNSQSGDDLAWRVSNIFNVTQGTGAYRIDIYSMALEDVNTLSRWLFGSGANSFSQYHPIDTTGTGAPYLSSVWAAVLYDSGLVGFVAFIGLLVACIYRFSNRWIGIIVPVTLLICSTTTNIVWFAFTWVYIALVEVSDERRSRDADRSECSIEQEKVPLSALNQKAVDN
ncbi:O-antigen ligase family protein [Rhodococcus fascians]|nr:O-antigen ligase family protein [Rhodococcus fascians]MBY4138173.1 O-antigen ligase family protein [Rhodococcus fascians]MBY4216120.1 O-antigen ligase family protein [Rhodococcus fascians]MBY4220649.1 O-antigen ligase family protein [Rhodococcus fascians]MBY4230808.1 O-antigen ligase family protein [Rhodococcus fascians]